MPAHRDHWVPVAQDLLTFASGLAERAHRCVKAAEAIDPGVRIPAELAQLLGLAAPEPAPRKRKRQRHVVAPTEPAPFGYKADGVTPRKRPAPSPSHQAALLAGRRNGASKEPSHA